MNGNGQRGSRPGAGSETLIFGIGNNGRGDDGLGWAFLDRIRKEPGFNGRLEYRYQLQVEDAALVSGVQRVIFVDSCRGGLPGGFRWAPCRPAKDFEFTTHVLPPRAVLHLCQELFGKTPLADLLMIQGTTWDLRMGLSPRAAVRLENAIRFFRKHVMSASSPRTVSY